MALEDSFLESSEEHSGTLQALTLKQELAQELVQAPAVEMVPLVPFLATPLECLADEAPSFGPQ